MRTEFEYFHFRPLWMDEAIAAITGPHDEEFKRQVYAEWLIEFSVRTHVVNVSQYDRHLDRVYGEFCRKYDIAPGYCLGDLPVAYAQEFDWFIEGTGLNEHQAAMELNEERTHRTIEGLHLNRPAWVDSTAAMSRLLEKLESGKLYPEDVTDELWGVWFDKVTSVGTERQQELRKMPYREYIQTSYWHRVRIAMMVAHRLRCQGRECYGLDNWHGGEFDLHVHHLHYKNKGRETFGNLRLLCADCHKRVHSGDVSVLPLPSLLYVNYMDDCDWQAIRDACKARKIWDGDYLIDALTNDAGGGER